MIIVLCLIVFLLAVIALIMLFGKESAKGILGNVAVAIGICVFMTLWLVAI